MTIAELFSVEPAENVLAALCLRPERVIFLGSRSVMTDGRIAAVRAFFRSRRQAPELKFLRVNDRDYAGIGAAIRDILVQYPDCRFETTGGSDLMLAALGTAAAERTITLFELDVRRQELRLVRGPADPALPSGAVRPRQGIPAGAFIRLNGGELAESSYTLGAKLPDGLERDADDLWSVYAREPESWTKECARLAALCAASRSAGLTVSGDMPQRCARSHIDRLLEKGLIADYAENGTAVTLTFRDAHVRRMLTRAGDLLELRVFLAARSLPSFMTDAVTGAKLRWTGGEPNATMNEIDGLLMCGAVPLFVSCKIGSVPKEALYELDSVAARFGGAYAGKALVCGSLGGSPSARQVLRQRAADMHILLIERADALSRSELAARLRQLAAEGPSVRLHTF